jgi:HlyD family secretion protein
MNDGFGGIKDTLLLGRDGDFVDRFHESGEELAYAQGSNTALSMAPRYLMELVAFGIVIALVLYLFEFYQGNLGAILPVVSVYALAGFKLLPAFQQIYVSVAQIKGNLPAFEAIKDDLKQSKTASGETIRDIEARNDLPFNKCIELIDVDFTYPGKETHALKGLDLSIPANSVVGIVGSSGSGKSTAIDIILGLIAPDRGSLHVDDQTVSGENIRSWQNRIGFVAQSIFLSEGTVAENVAFGIPREEIDREQVRRALQMAHLLEMIDDLPNGIDSKVGERGIQLSGGQRQRVGIARALYHEADVLIFDEATSALDGITEKMIMDAIHDFRGKKTIIMIAHRLKTVQDCDRIHMMENGRIVDSGSYQQLLETNELFRKMAAHA